MTHHQRLILGIGVDVFFADPTVFEKRD